MTQRRPAMRLILVAMQPEVELPVANLGFLHALKVGVAVGRVRTLSHEAFARARSTRCCQLDVAKFKGLLQALVWIASGNEFVADVPVVSDLDERIHDGRILNLLAGIQFTSARIAGGMDMTNQILVLSDSANHIAIHDLHMIDVE